MKLYVKRDTTDLSSGFSVLDECGHEKYLICLENKKPFEKVNIADMSGSTITKIRRIPAPGMFAYTIKNACDKNVRFMIGGTKEKPVCLFYGKNWHIQGNIFSKDFCIIDVDNSVIAENKGIMGANTIDIQKDENELLSVAVCACINLINTVDKPATQVV